MNPIPWFCSRLRWFTFIVGVMMIAASGLQAQVESGKVVGTVRDASGAVVAGASVTLVNPATNATRSVRTESDGEFVITGLPSGEYTVTVEHEGFKKVVQVPFKLDVNQVIRVDLTLVVGSINERVEVTAAEPLIEAETSSLGQVVEEQRVRELPLNGRNFVELAYLSPGVNAGPSGAVQQGGIPENQRGTGSIQANGLTATNNNFLLNGFDNNEQQIGIQVIQPAIDAIQEFKVQTNNFGADIGRGGAVVNVLLKSGSNQFHGNLYEFLRNSVFDAKNFFDDPAAPIVPFKQNQFGGTIGGPIVKNKLFFFADYQGTRIRQSQTDISSVPLSSAQSGERGGDFSDILGPQDTDPITHQPIFDALGRPVFINEVYDPASLHPDGVTRDGFGFDPITGLPISGQANIIPQNRLDSAALNVMQLFPNPNLDGTANNFLSNPVAQNNQNSFDIRVDHQPTSNDSLSMTFSYGKVDAHSPDPFPGLAGGGTFSGHVTNLALAAGVSYVRTFSATRINELKIGYSRYVVNAVPNFVGQDISDQVQIPGIFDPSNKVATGGLPFISISNFSPLGTTDWFPEFLRENSYQLVDGFTLNRGRHSWKFGADIRRRRHGFFQTQNSRSDWNFDQQFTQDLSSGAEGNALASFLLGYPISAFRDGQKGQYGMNWLEASAYLMDDFRVSPKLTLNLGVRYDLFTPMVEDHDRLANFDFATGQFVAPQLNGGSRSGNVKTDYNNFAPRLGFAYTPWHEGTVIRGGFGVFYDQQANQNDTELFYNPTGNFFSQNIFNPPSTTSVRLSTGLPDPVYPTLANPSGRASAALFNNRTTYIEEWNLNVERSLSKDMVLQVAYVGTHGVKLAHLVNLNQPVQPLDENFCGPDPANCAPNFNRPYFGTVPDIGPIRTEAHDFSSITHGLQVRFEKRLSHDWSMLSAYTWQHTIGQSEENEWLEPQNTHDLRAERGNNGPDYRHQFTSAWSYELPIGPKKRFLPSAGPTRWATEGWQLNGIISMYSGQAFTPLLSFDPTNTGSGAPRPDVIGNPYNFSNADTVGCPTHQTIQCWFNPAAYAVPAVAPGQSFATLFGNAGRGTLRGPAQYNVDFSVFKNFKFTETWNLQFRAEAFNLFNTPEFGLPYNAVTDAGLAGSISSTVHSSRQIQLALKLSF
jgi:hypothetical protein